MIRAGRVAAAAALLVAIAGATAGAHSGLRLSSPLDGSTLGAAPTHVQLTFVERPEPSLASIRVSDTRGDTYHVGRPEPLRSDPLTLTIGLRALPRGVYTVQWRVVSAVDGHASAGVFSFGVQMAPSGPALAAGIDATVSPLEAAARTLFLLGLLLALGAASSVLLRHELAAGVIFAGAGWLLAAVGLALLVAAQARVAGAGLETLAGTAIGRAWIARAGALGIIAIGIALAAMGSSRQVVRQLGMSVVALSACAAIAVHAAAGHAAAGRLPVASTVIVQAIHVAAAGVWLGGLAILIAGLRRPDAGDRARAIARFSNLAAIGLVLVTVTGIARSVHEIGEWRDLANTAYGAIVLAKVALLAAIAALGGLNRWRHVALAATDPRPLRRTATAEAGLAVLATVAAGVLGTLPPPASARTVAGIEVSGSDFATTVRATLTAASDQPGPNRFEVIVEDYDSGDTLTPDRVSLRFTPIDDPDVLATTLALARERQDVFTGTGANLSFDGRWRVNVLIERGNTSTEVPLDIEVRVPPQRVSVLRVPNEPPAYTVEVATAGLVEIIVDPERAGEARLQISCFNVIPEPVTVRDMVVTAAADEISAEPLAITRVDRHQFVTAVTLHRGTNRIVVTARTESGARLRATLDLELRDRD